ncbi:MAG: hypothetical protein ABWY08_05040 [Comamonas sp.]
MSITPIERSSAWRPQGADLYSTGASGAVAVRPINPVNPVESVDRLGEGAIVREPGQPDAPDQSNRDWTVVEEKKQAEEVEEPPKEPISKQLIEVIQSMWRASAMVVEHAEQVNKTDEIERNKLLVKEEPLTYSEPKIKRTQGL